MNIRHAILSLGISGLAGCASWQQFDGYLPTNPPANVIEAARVPGFEKRFSSLELQLVEEFVANGNLGMKNDLSGTRRLQVSADGLTSEVSRLTWGQATDGKVRGVVDVQQLSICGLQPLARDLAGKSVLADVKVAVSPVAVTTNSTDTIRTSLERLVVESLSGEAPKMCNPKPGTAYQFEVARQAQLRWSSIQNLRQHFVARISCRVADSTVPASSVIPGLDGDAIEVKCKAKYANEGDHDSRFMHFRSLGIYLPIETSEPERGRTVYRYVKASINALR